jgi:hypothetical protein
MDSVPDSVPDMEHWLVMKRITNGSVAAHEQRATSPYVIACH